MVSAGVAALVAAELRGELLLGKLQAPPTLDGPSFKPSISDETSQNPVP